ncbi:tRNA pseudouridine(55) synthase TruB [Clostridium felsineum]|uniref:tRNA pseudouridine synthase B n=1 Tax=Clostridium felsineum TaxID=36839 RepID=A0A1S8L4W4_9CLOT|nr:tRNA pseudouridine(55) synthase TruB [Clostridium felsineum]URZ06651.1 tRNA pseudouridine synthase B [Clostridium felsineum]URZ11684.1 tRNA pseudouridine synthase B [Clostridium felsineum]
MDGIINIFKPTGVTSFDVVRKVKKISKEKKVGHTGTLDPLASGVLPVCIGKSTKIVDLVMAGKKVYDAEMKLGEITDTYDREGKVLREAKVNLTNKEIIDAVMSFKGEISQVPPMYSALKVNGVKLYDLARKGIEIERTSRNVTIYDMNILNIDIPFVKFRVECSKGTYIRSLCYDIGEALGCGAMMYNLTRISSGIFNESKSIHLDNLNETNFSENIIPIDKCLINYEEFVVDEKFEKLLINGVNISDKRLVSKILDKKIYRVYNIEKKFLGLARLNENGFKMIKLLT